MYAKLDKGEFWLKEVVCLGYVIDTEGIFVNPRKVETILNWEKPINVMGICSFLRLARYY